MLRSETGERGAMVEFQYASRDFRSEGEAERLLMPWDWFENPISVASRPFVFVRSRISVCGQLGKWQPVRLFLAQVARPAVANYQPWTPEDEGRHKRALQYFGITAS